jgi:signal peptidase I
VFRYPHDTSQDYIKRVVGLPGDRIQYVNRLLTINGQPVLTRPVERYLEEGRAQYYQQFIEQLDANEHRIILDENMPVPLGRAMVHTHPNACQYQADGNGISCVVPEGYYFVMGDNRDHSEDSRFWGFVPERNLVGHAFFIWMNFGSFGRIGRFQ